MMLLMSWLKRFSYLCIIFCCTNCVSLSIATRYRLHYYLLLILKSFLWLNILGLCVLQTLKIYISRFVKSAFVAKSLKYFFKKNKLPSVSCILIYSYPTVYFFKDTGRQKTQFRNYMYLNSKCIHEHVFNNNTTTTKL